MKGHGFVCYLLLVYIVYISISYLFLGHLVPFLSPLSEMPPRCQLASSPLEPRFQPRRSSFENECYQHNSTEKADSQASRRIGIDGNGREIGFRTPLPFPPSEPIFPDRLPLIETRFSTQPDPFTFSLTLHLFAQDFGFIPPTLPFHPIVEHISKMSAILLNARFPICLAIKVF